MFKVLLLMAICGVLGACLANFRGFFYHYMYGGFFPNAKEIPYYVRPPMAALTGLFVFFVGSFLNTSLSYETDIPKWITLTGSIPSLAFAFLAGFSCLELMSRLKQVTESLFGYKPSTADTNLQPKDGKGKIPELVGIQGIDVQVFSTEGETNVCENPLESALFSIFSHRLSKSEEEL